MTVNTQFPARARAEVVAAAVPAGLSALAAVRQPQPPCAIGFCSPGVTTGWARLATSGVARPRRLRVWFPFASAMCHTLVSGDLRPALPFGHPLAVSGLLALSTLGKELTELTRPDGGLAANSGEQTLAVSVLVEQMLPAALAALGRVGVAHATGGHGSFVFSLGVRDGAAGWVARDEANAWQHGTGWPAQRPNAALVFADVKVAAAALAQQSDELAAVAGGQIEVRGRVPLADEMGRLLNTAGKALRPTA